MADEQTTGNNISNFLSDGFTGMKIISGIESGPVDTFGKRVGIVASVGLASIGLHSRLVQKPALKATLNEQDYQRVVEATPLGSLSLGA